MSQSSNASSTPVYFWQVDGTWPCFMSQWYPCTFSENGVTYDCAEKYMMHQKAVLFGDEETAAKIAGFMDADEYFMCPASCSRMARVRILERTIEATTPKEQKALGRQVKNFDSAKWNEHKERIVQQGNVLKFSQSHSQNNDVHKGAPMRDLLLATEDRELIEASPEDRIWGIGFTAKDAEVTPRNEWGQNLLGEALMVVRASIKE